MSVLWLYSSFLSPQASVSSPRSSNLLRPSTLNFELRLTRGELYLFQAGRFQRHVVRARRTPVDAEQIAHEIHVRRRAEAVWRVLRHRSPDRRQQIVDVRSNPAL